MPQVGSAAAAASNPLIADWKAKECSRAAARVNSACAAGLHEVGKFTVPSFSDVAAGRVRSSRSVIAIARTRIVILLPCHGRELSVSLAYAQGVPACRHVDLQT
jgi:hypothetical protein